MFAFSECDRSRSVNLLSFSPFFQTFFFLLVFVYIYVLKIQHGALKVIRQQLRSGENVSKVVPVSNKMQKFIY